MVGKCSEHGPFVLLFEQNCYVNLMFLDLLTHAWHHFIAHVTAYVQLIYWLTKYMYTNKYVL